MRLKIPPRGTPYSALTVTGERTVHKAIACVFVVIRKRMSEELASDEISANTIDGSPAKAKPVGPTIPAPAAPRSPAAGL